MKKYLIFILITLFLIPSNTLALNKAEAIEQYAAEWMKIGMKDAADAKKKATDDADALIEGMETAQYDMDVAYKALETRVNGLLKNDARRDSAKNTLENAEKKVKAFTALEAQNKIDLQPATAGATPRLLPDSDFELARSESEAAINEVNRILIAPVRPGAVPEGDLVNDFLPQLIRQLFRFAWVAILVALTVSGVMLVLSKDKEERVTKAKEMIYYSVIGFAVIALAFAVVKAITDIDFFAFI